MNWIYWLVIVIILSLVEAFTVNLVSIWFVLSGIVALLLSFFIENDTITFSIFVLLGLFLLILTKPIVNRLKKSLPKEKTNLERLIGENAIVTEEITDSKIGEVKIQGKRWSAISKDHCKNHDLVKVEKIDGVKLIVRKVI